MKKVIWKFIITPGHCYITMPLGSNILTVQPQGNDICLWAEVGSEQNRESRAFEVYATGSEIHGVERNYIGTVQFSDGGLVYHIFERLDK